MTYKAELTDNFLLGLDIGSAKICAAVGRMDENGETEIAGVGVTPSAGVKNGVVVNIESTAGAIRKVVEDAKYTAGCDDLDYVIVGISGQQIKGESARGVISITKGDRTITRAEVQRVIVASQNEVLVPSDRQIMHILDKEFSVDNQSGIKTPIGMTGSKLEAFVHVITGLTPVIQNIKKAVERAGLNCDERNIIFSPLASSGAVLDVNEQDMGVALIDIGAGTTDILVFHDGGIVYSGVLPVGGIHVTSDISQGITTPLEAAELIKRTYGCAVLDLVDPAETLEVPSVGGRPPRTLFRQELIQIIEPRMLEIMEMIDQELIKSKVKDMLGAGIVFTGGTSMMDGTIEAAEKVINLPARIGVPRQVSGLKEIILTPQYANVVGLLKYGNMMRAFREQSAVRTDKPSFLSRLKRIIEDYL